jgi:hypothetical protein
VTEVREYFAQNPTAESNVLTRPEFRDEVLDTFPSYPIP